MTATIGSAISVVVVSYQTGPALWLCLYRLLQQQGVGEVIVVDNGNPPEVSQHLQEMMRSYPRLHYVASGGNIGFAAGCNLGASHATGKYIALVNPDAIIMEHDGLWKLATLLADGQNFTPRPWLAGGVLRYEDGREQRASRRAIMTPQNAMAEGIGLTRLFPDSFAAVNIHHTPLPDHPAPVPAVSGACMMMERAKYQQMGGFDEGYFLHMEDMDLCLRVQQQGGSVWIHPQVDILHYRSTSKASTLFVEKHKTKGFCRYFGTHYAAEKWPVRAAKLAAWARYSLRIVTSFFSELQPVQHLKAPYGLRQAQAILRGMHAAYAEGLAGKGAGTVIMVTGASTSVGLFATGRFLAMGCKVVAVCRRSQVGYFHPNLVWVHAELEQPESFYAVVQNHPCHYLLHAAPVPYLPKLLDSMAQIGIERIVMLSDEALLYAQPKGTPQAQLAWLSKVKEAEHYIADKTPALNIEWVILRPCLAYGAGIGGRLRALADHIDRWRICPMPIKAKGMRAPVHADDVARAVIYAIIKPEAHGKAYALSGGEIVQSKILPYRLGHVMNVRARVLPLPCFKLLLTLLHPLFKNAVPHPSLADALQQDLVFHDERVTTELNTQPRPFLKDGLLDLGEASEELCRSLLPVLPAS